MVKDECPYQHDSLNSRSSSNLPSKFLPNDHHINSSTNLPETSKLQSDTTPISQQLPTNRTASSIPRTDTPHDDNNNTDSSTSTSNSRTWMYPSPKMFYNALLRKGYDTKPEDVEVMVDVHNFLNEQVWSEVLKWEHRHKSICGEPKLKRFLGRPKDLSPRARICSLFYGTPRPFDRHDWTVDRCGRDVRYIIDYYSGPKGEEGTFYCDVRPALDSWDSFIDRSRTFWEEKKSKIFSKLFN